ncbi:hypothetical protein TW65_97101 [Stemphylium lycopersici]|nr:hypothetical protein TW65_97101 [Stemphylium lycopersici]
MVQLTTLILTTALSLSLPAAAQVDFCAGIQGSPWSESATGFRFRSTGSSTWNWSSRDRGTDLQIFQDCMVRQNRPNSQRALRQFCIATSNDYNCWEAPGQNEPSGSCRLPDCSNIANVWGWFD